MFYDEFRITISRQDLNTAVASYSNFKHNLTGTFLVGVVPNGTFTFVSDRIPGNTSEKFITEKSGILTYSIAILFLLLLKTQ